MPALAVRSRSPILTMPFVPADRYQLACSHQPDPRVAAADAPAGRADHQCQLDPRAYGLSRNGRLFGGQGRDRVSHAPAGRRAGPVGYNRECGGARRGPHRHDSSAARTQLPTPDGRANPARARLLAGGAGGGDRLPASDDAFYVSGAVIPVDGGSRLSQ